jgi:DNA-binding NarL/FixJ family response regulator
LELVKLATNRLVEGSLNKTEQICEAEGAERSFSVLLAEPNPLMREKIASMLARYDTVWCVINVCSEADLIRSASHHHPDLILVDLNILREQKTVESLRRIAPLSRIIAIADSCTEPYLRAAHRLGLDGLIEKALVGEKFLEQIESCSFSGDD